ncbi:MAG: pyruvate kinase alpha/beta domain-containing protein [Candidatus Bipolaricaulota bacterium]
MYWDEPGRKNTEKTLKLVKQKAAEMDIAHVVIASNTGETARTFYELTDGDDLNIVCVSHHVGFRDPGGDEMSKRTREEFSRLDVPVLTTTHLLAGVDRGVRNEYGGLYPPEIIANSLRMLSEGVKVSVEISIMALDAGLIPHESDVIAVGGSGRGADSACIIKPAHSSQVFDTDVKEVICRPRSS